MSAAAGIAIALASEPLELLPDRALFWPRTQTLIVTDVHLGKGAAFRRHGVAVPSGSTRHDLARIATLIDATKAQRLLVLGDLFHTRLVGAEDTFAAFDAFRATHLALAITAVRGNHDRGVERLPVTWKIRWHEGSLHEPPFVFAHEPEADPRGWVVAGHIHPVVQLRSRLDSARLPVFWLRRASRIAVLPAFGAFTGGWPVGPDAADTVVAVTPDGLVALQSGDPDSP